MISKTFSKDELIFAELSFDDCMYDIVSGTVGIYANYLSVKEKLLVTLEDGDTFGELGMIEKRPRSATAVALEDTTVNIISYEDFNEYFKDKPEKVKNILKNTSHRMRILTKDYIDVCSAISEYVDCKENGNSINDELMARMEKISEEGKN